MRKKKTKKKVVVKRARKKSLPKKDKRSKKSNPKKKISKRAPKRVRVYSTRGKKVKTNKRKGRTSTKRKAEYFIDQRYHVKLKRIRESARTNAPEFLEGDSEEFQLRLKSLIKKSFNKHKILNYKKLYAVSVFVKTNAKESSKGAFFKQAHNGLYSFRPEEKNKAGFNKSVAFLIDFLTNIYESHGYKDNSYNLFVQESSDKFVLFNLIEALTYVEYVA